MSKDDTPKHDEPEITVEVDEPTEAATDGERGAPAGEEAAATPPSAEERIATLEQEKRDVYDRLLRSAADLENFRKRSRREAEDARTRAREEVLREMLPVIDNLERALASTPGADESGGVVAGVKLVLRQFQNALEKFQVKAFDSRGEAFDPTRHEAITQIETTDTPPGTVAAEMQRGYLIGDRLLRPALVAVARAPAPPPSAEAPAAGEDEQPAPNEAGTSAEPSGD